MISRITLGTAQLTSLYGIAYSLAHSSSVPEKPLDILQSALDAGICSIDTAPSYADSESAVGCFLKKNAEKNVTLCTKLPSACRHGVDLSEIEGFVDENVQHSCDALGGGIDYYLLHDCADLKKYGMRIVHALDKHRELGSVRHIGLSVYDVEEMMWCLEYPIFDTVQFPANIFDHRFLVNSSIDFVRERGITAFARSVYLQGMFLVDPKVGHAQVAIAQDYLQSLRTYARNTGWEVDSLAFAFIHSFPHIDSMVIGMETRQQIQRNRGNLELKIPEGMRDEILGLFSDVADTVYDPRLWGRR